MTKRTETTTRRNGSQLVFRTCHRGSIARLSLFGGIELVDVAPALRASPLCPIQA